LTEGDLPSAPPDAAALGRARQAALRLLAIRDRSRRELETRLGARHPAPVVGRVLAELTDDGYLDDDRLARRLARWYAAERDYGPARIRLELTRRGLSPDAGEAALGEAEGGPGALAETALRAARRYFRARPHATDERTARRLAGYLERRGFPGGTVRAIVRLSRQGRLWDDG
jgi:regulatory protein